MSLEGAEKMLPFSFSKMHFLIISILMLNKISYSHTFVTSIPWKVVYEITGFKKFTLCMVRCSEGVINQLTIIKIDWYQIQSKS